MLYYNIVCNTDLTGAVLRLIFIIVHLSRYFENYQKFLKDKFQKYPFLVTVLVQKYPLLLLYSSRLYQVIRIFYFINKSQIFNVGKNENKKEHEWNENVSDISPIGLLLLDYS